MQKILDSSLQAILDSMDTLSLILEKATESLTLQDKKVK